MKIFERSDLIVDDSEAELATRCVFCGGKLASGFYPA
jgi:hypothetical protein